MFVRALILSVIACAVLASVLLVVGRSELNDGGLDATTPESIRSAAGAYDLASDLEVAVDRLTASIVNQLHARNMRGVDLRIMPADRLNVTEEDGLMMEALAASFQEHEFSCRVYPHENESGHLRLKYGVDPNHFQGRRLSLRGTGRNQPEAIVFLQDSAKPVAVVPITTDQMVIRLLTSIGQDNEFESRIDARHHMALRLRLEALSLARRRDWIEFGEESEFLELHEAEYSEEALVGMGLSELTTQERDIDEVAYFESVIAWRGDRRSFESMTRGISDRIRLKHRMPWIKGLLMCAFTILCVLGWFKVDWWLKGNYSLLSALGFVLVFCVSLGLIWSFRYDALI